MKQWTDKHGEDGLRAKFIIFKPRDELAPTGSRYERESLSAEPSIVMFDKTDAVGADGEFVFVLRPETDFAAYSALWDYADATAHRAPKLAADIREQLERIRGERAAPLEPAPEPERQSASELLTECHGCNGTPCPGRCPWL